jgi:hypothetical protein
MDLHIPRLALCRVSAWGGSFAVEVQIGRHPEKKSITPKKWGETDNAPDSHPQKQPSFVLLIPLNRPAPPERQKQIRLHDLQRFVPPRRNGEGQLLRKLRKLRM